MSVAAIAWPLLSKCLVTGVIAEPFPINGCLWWLHTSCFHQVCHIPTATCKVFL
jgi:hypothetical protein